MSLRGVIARLQKAGADLYLSLAQQFSANDLIRETWISWSQDLQHQAASLEALSRLFWKCFEDAEKSMLESIDSRQIVRNVQQPLENHLNVSFERVLEYEEPLILKVYVPLIRRLRVSSTNQALDFYITVKAHVAKLPQVIQPFTGDPALVRRAIDLQINFEKEVQMPEKVTPPVAKPVWAKKSRSRRSASQRAISVGRRSPLGQPAKQLLERTRPAARAVKLRQSRARN